MEKYEKITTEEVIELRKKGCCVHGMPKKGLICVNGFKIYSASKATIKEAKNRETKETESV